MAQPGISYEHILGGIEHGLQGISLEPFQLDEGDRTLSLQATPTLKEFGNLTSAKLNEPKAFRGLSKSLKDSGRLQLGAEKCILLDIPAAALAINEADIANRDLEGRTARSLQLADLTWRRGEYLRSLLWGQVEVGLG